MHVKNRAVIRYLSFKTLLASGKRNLIAVAAIALTSLLFTSVFTIAFSVNESMQTYTFRQIGGYSHGTFKEVTPEQAAAIAAHPRVKKTGLRTAIGIADAGVFSRNPAEISFMDENCTQWCYAAPATGRMPQSGKEISMDTAALSLLGVVPTVGARVELTWTVSDAENAYEKTDTFTLVGWWEYDEISPVHYINVSEEYVRNAQTEATAAGMGMFHTDLNVMLSSAVNILGQMEQIDTDLGYTWDTPGAENNVRIGENWGYTSSRISDMDMETVLALAAFIILIVFTGYLIIYNVFQISVTGDIRFTVY